MARIRTIKPEFWTDEKLAECSVAARLLFIGMWNFCDDSGRMEFSPKRLKMQVFPGDNIEVAPLVEELNSHGLVIVYRIENRDFLCVPKFGKHQRIDKPTASKIPPPGPEDSQSVPRTFQESSENDRCALAPEGKGMEGKGMEGRGLGGVGGVPLLSQTVTPRRGQGRNEESEAAIDRAARGFSSEECRSSGQRTDEVGS